MLVGLGLAHPAVATDVVVGTGQASSCTEAAFTTAVNTVRAAGGTITFNCGGPATITVTSQKLFQNFGNPNLVYAIDGGGIITLSGGGTTRILYHTSGTLNLRNITFSGGRAQGAEDNASGGAIRSDAGIQPAHLNLTNVTFTGNFTNLTTPPSPPFSPFDYGGGALFTRFGIVTIANCTFANNTANNTAGGALHIRSSTVNITGSVFNANASNGGGFGGAIHADGVGSTPTGTGGTLQISATSFTNNTALNQGGAIFAYLYPSKGESVTLNTINMTGNQVLDSSGTTYLGTRTFGGGIAIDQGDATILNSTIANNRVHSDADGGTGGGLSLTANGTVRISNSTVSNNRAEGSNANAIGGGLLISGNSQPFVVTHTTIAQNFAGSAGGGIVSQANGTLRNTIVAGNTAAASAQCSAQLTNGGGVLEFPSNNPHCVSGATVADPLLAPLASNGGFSQTHLPQAGSPAIDAASCVPVLAADQRGVVRPQGPACDLGAVEIQGPPPPATDFFTLDPCRVIDTRLPTGPTGGAPLTCGVDRVFTLTGGACGVPVSAKGVAVNVTVAQPSAQGNVNAFAPGPLAPETSIMNYTAGLIRSNNAVIKLSAGGQVTARCAPSGTTHVIIDVTGYFQ
jgi:predicted outer membrane repeat protein